MISKEGDKKEAVVNSKCRSTKKKDKNHKRKGVEKEN